MTAPTSPGRLEYDRQVAGAHGTVTKPRGNESRQLDRTARKAKRRMPRQ